MVKTSTAAIALALIAAGCASSGDPTLSSPTPDVSIPGSDPDCPTDGQEYALDDRPSSTAKIDIRQPERGAVFVAGEPIQVKVRIRGACILSQTQQRIRPDTGHVHIGLDDRTLELFAGLEYELTDVEPGNHILEVEFSAADHNPFNPPVTETTTFRVVEQ